MRTTSETVSTSELLGIALPALPLFALMMPTVVFMPALYAEHRGLDLELVATIFMVAKFWDMLSDPVFGYVAETVRLPFGRRRPWVILSAPLLMLSVHRIFVPPPEAGALYLGAWLIVFYLAWTMFFLTLLAWAAELSRDSHQRARIMGAIQMANSAGMIGIVVVAVLADRASSGDAIVRAQSMAWTVIVLLPIFVALLIRNVPEREAPAREAFRLGETMRVMWQSVALRRLVVADLLAGLIVGLAASLLLFFAQHTLRLGAAGSALILIGFTSNLVFIPLWIKIAGRIGKQRALVYAGLYTATAHSLFLVMPAENLPVTGALMLVVGVATGALQFLPRAILADVIDETEEQGGGRRETAYYALLSATFKTGMAGAVGLGLYSLAFFGFDPRAAETTGSAETIRYVLFAYPAAFGVGIALLIKGSISKNGTATSRSQ